MRLLMAGFAGALIGLFSCPYAFAQGQPLSPADEAAIRVVIAREHEGWDKFDAEEVASVYTDDAVWQNPFGVRIHGRQELQKFVAGLMSGTGFRAGKSTTPVKILDLRLTSPTTAAVWSDERIAGLVNDNSGQPVPPRHSYYLEVLVKAHGEWRISDELIMDVIHLK